jgi:hypothetical protein
VHHAGDVDHPDMRNGGAAMPAAERNTIKLQINAIIHYCRTKVG